MRHCLGAIGAVPANLPRRVTSGTSAARRGRIYNLRGRRWGAVTAGIAKRER